VSAGLLGTRIGIGRLFCVPQSRRVVVVVFSSSLSPPQVGERWVACGLEELIVWCGIHNGSSFELEEGGIYSGTSW